MSTISTASSSWVRRLEYVRFADGITIDGANGFLVVDLPSGRYAYTVPSWQVGLLAAYIARFGSPGRAFNRLLRGRHVSVKMEG